jgi:hypothetical protein
VDAGLSEWSQSDRYFESAGVGALATAIDAGMKKQGIETPHVEVQSAEEAGHYSRNYRGYSVALSCA